MLHRGSLFLVLLVVLAGCMPASAPAASTPTPTAFPTPLAATPTPTVSPTPTPSPAPETPASRIAFYSNRDGNPEIYVMQADGTGLTRLTDDPAFDDSPALSPDGTRIAFLSARHDPAPKFPNLKYELYVVDVESGEEIRLTTTEATEGHPAWSPDGTRISFDADYDGDGYAEIYTLAPDGKDLTRLTFNLANDQFADWSPDGTQIAFASERNGNWDLFVMDADGSNQRPLTESPAWELFPAWSPDGMQIAYTFLQPNSRNTDVFVMHADGSEPRQLTDTSGFDENPVWSPDGEQIAFQSARGGTFGIYVMNADGSDPRLITDPTSDALWPSWGPRALSTPGDTSPTVSFEQSNQDLGLRETFQAALGDLDGDGDLDAVFANPMRNPGAVWLNDGSGTLVDTGQALTQYGHGVGLADFDGDGDLDAVLVCHQTSRPTTVYLNDGTGTFAPSGQEFGDARISASDLNLLDLNGDGQMDFHVLYYSPSGVVDRVYLNDGHATFTDSGLSLDEDFIAWGDLDGDGDVDYFGKHWHEGYVVRLNDGSGAFATGWQLDDPQANVGDVALTDFDVDGDLDALIANGFRDTGSLPAQLLWNDGSGNFTESGWTLGETMGSHIAVGDLDLDGRPDVFVTRTDSPDAVWLNHGDRFVDAGLRLGEGSDMSGRPTLGDLDGDGDLDVVVGRFEGGAQIWFNNYPGCTVGKLFLNRS